MAIVEHTSINPNKAAHIGHLRNAILGDTFVRLLRAAGYKVDVQNYIDNTGVQVADVVVGFLHLEKKSAAEVRARRSLTVRAARRLSAGVPRPQRMIDYYCWDLYARTSQWYGEGAAEEQSRARNKSASTRFTTSKQGGNETAEIADLISTAVLRRHLETMLRLGIEYDFLPRESEILHLKFWEAAFEQLKQSGVLYFENEGKNKGCWVMTRPARPQTQSKTRTARRALTKMRKSSSAPTAPSPTSAKTSPTTSGSSACWAATSATSRSSLIRITSAGSRPNTARKTIRTSAAPPPSTTSSMRASPTRSRT